MTTQQHETVNPLSLAAIAANAADSKKALGLKVLDVGNISSISDYFVFCTADNPVQIKAIANAIEEAMNQIGHSPIGKEKDQVGKWNVLDYGDIVVHIMHPQMSEYYGLEKFWNHATPIAREKWEQSLQLAS